MSTYVVRRLLGVIPQLLLLLALVVVLVRAAPTSAIDTLTAQQGVVTKQTRHQLEDALGLDQPVYEQYGRYLWGVLHGDLGTSLFRKRAVGTLLKERAPVTLELGLDAIVVSALVGIGAGVLAGLARGTLPDYALRIGAVLALGIPGFVVAEAMILFPALWWHVRPPVYAPWSAGVLPHLQSMILPVIALAIGPVAVLLRLARSSIIQVSRQDYIQTARAKGLRSQRLWLVHGLKNALLPSVTLIGLQAAALVGSAVIVEQVFSMPGLGIILFNALGQKDYPIIQGFVVVIGAAVILVNTLIDVSYSWLDPRIHFG